MAGDRPTRAVGVALSTIALIVFIGWDDRTKEGRTMHHTRALFLSAARLMVVCAAVSLALASCVHAETNWPRKVLITNDNGISDPKLVALARAFSEVATTVVVAPATDQSGTSNHISLGQDRPLVEVEARDLGGGIEAYALDGYPADCVFWALAGLLRESPPDLVVSGINGGPNLGPDWIGSGTIGAARIAAFGGFPAIAVSGLDDGLAGAVAAATKWVVALAQSPIVQELERGQFLTVSIPRVPPEQIKGVRVVKRAPIVLAGMPWFEPDTTKIESAGKQTWAMRPPTERGFEIAGDIAAYQSNYIAVVPMRVDEHDYELLEELEGRLGDFPPWPGK
jgi:5'-nucleotidase